MCPDIFLIYFISFAVILVASIALMIQFSLPCNRAGSWTPVTCSVETGSLNKPRTNWHYTGVSASSSHGLRMEVL